MSSVTSSSTPAPTRLTGGCQCGAVRYAVTPPLVDPHVCHCRMCQRAVGGPFAALVSVPHQRLSWLMGAPALFASSSVAERGFCQACGTPLTFAYVGGAHINVTIASLDDPAAVAPRVQYGIESRLDWTCTLARLPGTRTDDDVHPVDLAAIHSHQSSPDPSP